MVAACKVAGSKRVKKEQTMKLTSWQWIALLLQWSTVIWLNLRIEADLFNQLVLVPLLLMLSLVLLLPKRHEG
jgi:hypothetical protein